MNEHKAEGDGSSRGDGIDAASLASICIGDEPINETFEVFGSGADKIGNGGIRVAISLADEASLSAPAHMHKAGIPDHNALQIDEFIAAERSLSSF